MIWRTGILVGSKARQLSAEALSHLGRVPLNILAGMLRQTQGAKRFGMTLVLSSRAGGINQWHGSQFNAQA
jgi:hypothetical protein